jgi:uncharacterized protein (TIGR02246 family)
LFAIRTDPAPRPSLEVDVIERKRIRRKSSLDQRRSTFPRQFIIIAILLMVFTLSYACGGEGGEKSSEQIRSALVNWQERFNARDSGAVCDLFAPDLVADFQGQPERNFSQICALLQSSLSDTSRNYHYDLDIKDIFSSGKLGAVRLVLTLTVTDNKGNVIDTSIEPGIDIFQRQRDGHWRIARYISYPRTSSS